MKKIYKWGILGCGKIARKFSTDLKLLPDARLYAVASRDPGKASRFAEELGFEKAYGSYQEMVNDPEVEIVYVATPHSFHFEHVMLCLNHGKAVLNEKPFALNLREAKKMADKARSGGIFLMEAFWTRFQPGFQKALEIIRSGSLGALRIVHSDFAFNAPKNPLHRLYNVELGGGSLLDIGIYPVFAALAVMGKPESVKALATFADTGAEESIAITFRYAGGEMASLYSSFAAYSLVSTEYNCERGAIRMSKRCIAPASVTIWKEDGTEEIFNYNFPGAGYQFEAAHVMECLNTGKTESPLLPLDFSLDLMDTLDRIRTEAGIVFPGRD